MEIEDFSLFLPRNWNIMGDMKIRKKKLNLVGGYYKNLYLCKYKTI